MAICSWSYAALILVMTLEGFAVCDDYAVAIVDLREVVIVVMAVNTFKVTLWN